MQYAVVSKYSLFKAQCVFLKDSLILMNVFFFTLYQYNHFSQLFIIYHMYYLSVQSVALSDNKSSKQKKHQANDKIMKEKQREESKRFIFNLSRHTGSVMSS